MICASAPGVSRWVVLVRGVNVGGHARLGMPDLRRVLGELGASQVVTYLQSGNAVLTAVGTSPAAFADQVSEALRAELALTVRVVVRTAEDLAAVVAANPFPAQAATPQRLHVVFLGEPLEADWLARVGSRHGDDEIAVGDRVLYLSYAEGSRDSPLQRPLRSLGSTSTARNWSTVTRLVTLAGAC